MKRAVRMALSLQDEPFFQSMSAPVMGKVEAVIYHRTYEERQIVYFPDDPCDYVYWVREGRIKVTRVSPDRRELTFRHVLPGDMLGEECLAARRRRDDYAEALESTTLCLMRAEDFQRLVAEEAELARAVAICLAQRVMDVEEVLAETVFNTVRGRIAAGLLRLHKRRNATGKVVLRLTHQELANLIGSTRETTTAVLHGLREEGIIEIANRRLTVLDPVALEHAARTG